MMIPAVVHVGRGVPTIDVDPEFLFEGTTSSETESGSVAVTGSDAFLPGGEKDGGVNASDIAGDMPISGSVKFAVVTLGSDVTGVSRSGNSLPDGRVSVDEFTNGFCANPGFKRGENTVGDSSRDSEDSSSSDAS